MSALELLREEVKQKVEQADIKVLKAVALLMDAPPPEAHHDIEKLTLETLPGWVREDVERAQQDFNAGRGIPHSAFMKELNKWRTR